MESIKMKKNRPYNHNDNHNALIGFIAQGDGKLYCDVCIDKHESNPDKQIKVYLSNILPYNQHCADCKELIVHGQSMLWPDLFDGYKNPLVNQVG